MALPYITTRQTKIITNDMIEYMEEEGEMKVEGGSPIEPIKSDNEIETICKESNLGKIYQYKVDNVKAEILNKTGDFNVEIISANNLNDVLAGDNELTFTYNDAWTITDDYYITSTEEIDNSDGLTFIRKEMINSNLGLYYSQARNNTYKVVLDIDDKHIEETVHALHPSNSNETTTISILKDAQKVEFALYANVIDIDSSSLSDADHSVMILQVGLNDVSETPKNITKKISEYDSEGNLLREDILKQYLTVNLSNYSLRVDGNPIKGDKFTIKVNKTSDLEYNAIYQVTKIDSEIKLVKINK